MIARLTLWRDVHAPAKLREEIQSMGEKHGECG